MILQLTNLFDIIYMVIGVEMALAVLFYYLAKFTGADKYVGYTKDILVNVIITVFLTFLMLGIMSFIEKVSEDVAKAYFQNVMGIYLGPTTLASYDMVDLTLAIMEQGPFRCLISIRNSVYFLYGHLLTAAPAQMNYKFLEGTSSKVGIYGMAIENIIAQTIYYEIVYFLLFKVMTIIKYYLFPLLFPIGIAIRAFKPFRGAGAFLMALSFSFYVIFPFIYLFVISQYPVESSCIGTIDNFKNKCEVANPQAVSEFNILKSLAIFGDLGSDFLAASGKIELFIRDISLAFCIFPFLAFAFSVMSTNILTSLFGGKIPEIGRGLVKFI